MQIMVDSTTSPATGPDRLSGAWVGYCAALWSFIFAIFHVIWAMGCYVGLNPESARIAFAKTPFLIYNIAVACICLFAVPVALALVMPWGRRLPRWLLGFFAWTGTGLLVVRSVASIVQAVYLIATGQFPIEIWAIWEPWFYLGAILFSFSTLRFWLEPERGRK
jgi:hypothetical protein